MSTVHPRERTQINVSSGKRHPGQHPGETTPECPEWSLCELPAVERFPPSPGDGQAISVEERGLSKSLVGSD